MIPRKVKTLYPEIAAELELPEELVTDVIEFYWKEIKKELDGLTHIAITIESFGTFEARKRQVEYLIKKYKSIIKHMKPTTYSKHALMNIAVDKLERLETMLKMCENQELKKKQVREIQKNGKTV